MNQFTSSSQSLLLRLVCVLWPGSGPPWSWGPLKCLTCLDVFSESNFPDLPEKAKDTHNICCFPPGSPLCLSGLALAGTAAGRGPLCLRPPPAPAASWVPRPQAGHLCFRVPSAHAPHCDLLRGAGGFPAAERPSGRHSRVLCGASLLSEPSASFAEETLVSWSQPRGDPGP